MKILYFYQYFSTSQGSWGTRVYEFSKNWIAQGHEVTVVTSIYSKSDLKSQELISAQRIEGIEVKVINVLIDNRQSVVRRIWGFMKYATISSWFAVRLKADVVIASSGPITVGIPGLVAKKLRGRKLIFEARDLWPEGAVKMGILKNRLLIKLAYWFERVCYKNASVVVGLSPGIRDNIKNRYPGVIAESVTNAVNIALFSTAVPLPSGQSPRSYALYFGNIGEVNHSNFLLDAAKILMERGRKDIQILLIGEGQLKEELLERAARENLSNVVFLDLMPKSTLVGYVQHALASMIPLKPLPVFDTSSPNKLFESMAAGVPVIQTTQGWIKDFIAQHDVGFTVSGKAPVQLADILIKLKDNPELGSQMGRSGAAAARKYFDKDLLATKMLNILKSVHAQ